MLKLTRHDLPKILSVVTLCLVLAGTALCPKAAIGEEPPLPVPERKYLGMILHEGRYLEGWQGLEATAAKPDSDPDAIALSRSFVLGGAQDYRQAGEKCSSGAIVPALAGARPTDALREIVEQAKRSRVVILNEDHYEPRHRAFALRLARALRPLGYNHLAAEALNDRPVDEAAAANMEQIRSRGYVVRRDGIYTNEPMFAAFLREALKLGYRLHSYDGSTGDSVDGREEWQAQTIARRVIAKFPRDKVFIYVGFRHVTQVPFDGGLGHRADWMATRLARITGVDPLTIDQRQAIPEGCLPGQLVAQAMRASPTGSVVYKKGGKPVPVGDYAGAVDITVLHFPQRPVNSRPGWMAWLGRHAVPLPMELLAGKGPSLVELHVKGAAPDAIALDRVLVKAGEHNPPPVMTAERDFEFRVQMVPSSGR